MKRLSSALACVFILSFVLTAWAGNENLDKLHGKWAADAGETMKVRGKSLDSELDSEFERQMAEKIFGSITMDIDSKKKKISAAMGKKKGNTSAFKVVSDSENSIVLEFGVGRQTFEFINDDMMVIRDEKEPGKDVVFRRVR